LGPLPAPLPADESGNPALPSRRAEPEVEACRFTASIVPNATRTSNSSFGVSDTAACPTCKSKKVTRLMSRVAPPSRSNALRKAMRAQATREGDLSNFSTKERSTFKG
jgi:hypothetical protein